MLGYVSTTLFSFLLSPVIGETNIWTIRCRPLQICWSHLPDSSFICGFCILQFHMANFACSFINTKIRKLVIKALAGRFHFQREFKAWQLSLYLVYYQTWCWRQADSKSIVWLGLGLFHAKWCFCLIRIELMEQYVGRKKFVPFSNVSSVNLS